MKIIRFLILSIFSVTLFFTCGGDQVQSLVDNPGLKVIPSNYNIIASLNVNTLLNDPLLKPYVQKEPDFMRMETELKKIGINVYEDVRKVYFGSTEALLEDSTRPTADFVAYIEMSYDEEKLKKFLREKNKGKYSEKTRSGVTVFSSNDPRVNAELALYKNRAIVISRKNKISKYITLLNGNGEDISQNKKIIGHLNSVLSNNLAWGFIESSQSLKKKINTGNLVNLEKELKKVELATFGMNKKENLNVTVNQVTPDDPSAKKLSKELTNVINFSKMFLAKKISPDSLNSISVEPKGKTAVLTMEILKADLENLTQTASLIKLPTKQ